ncbi:hypothetical protein UMM65_16040 [Aureibaculum sp. 2210JD6-5]|uniref:hypothetical protein n=1 Tax=Aureibaculum sp. 2210JD6-5 TaxID=3103957 RepID=UPI002AADF466|nr:hypothetical protein [Aureibaculum sp. 2210JD6-5]MDY7396760.1 hypothetical protein [Aureibaculum sp. 2210JD6-5]
MLQHKLDLVDLKRNAKNEPIAIDTIKIYNLRNMRGGVANGLNSLIYENNQVDCLVQLFGKITMPHIN